MEEEVQTIDQHPRHNQEHKVLIYNHILRNCDRSIPLLFRGTFDSNIYWFVTS